MTDSREVKPKTSTSNEGKQMTEIKARERCRKPDWLIVLVLALPIFGATMWYGIAHHYEDMALYAIAMAIGSWSIPAWGVHAVRNWQAWQRNRKKENAPDEIINSDQSNDDWYEQMPRIQQLWVDLERAQFNVKECEGVLERFQLKPWDCDDPLITEAWNALTAPENLAELENWRKPSLQPTEFPTAPNVLEYMDKAVEDCRRKRKAEPYE